MARRLVVTVLAFAFTLGAAACFELEKRPNPDLSEGKGVIAGRIVLGSSLGSTVRGMSTTTPADRPALPPLAPTRDVRTAPTPKKKPAGEWKPGEVVTFSHYRAFDDETMTRAMGAVLAREMPGAGVRARARLCSYYICTVDLVDAAGAKITDAARTEELAKLLHKHRPDGVKVVSRNFKKYGFRVPNDEFYDTQQWHYEIIHLPAAWDLQVGDDDVVTAVIDSGVVKGHPDLNARLVRDPLQPAIIGGADFLSDPGLDADGVEGRDLDAEDPGDLLFGDRSSFHGTHISGTIAAMTDNGQGVAGVTWFGRILPVRVLGLELGGFDSDIADAILWSVGVPGAQDIPPNPTPARIVNLSLGGPAVDEQGQAFWDEVIRIVLNDPDNVVPVANPIVVAAVGNDQIDARDIVPANTAGMIAVGAIRVDGLRATYSNYGNIVDVMAPGGQQDLDQNGDGTFDGILSTWENTYDLETGTSMAAPHVTGIAGLMIAQNPALTQAQVETILKNTADPRGRCTEGCGQGIVDAPQALLLSGGDLSPLPVLSADTSEVFIRNGFQTAVFHVLNLGESPFDFTTEITGAQAALFRVTPSSGTVEAAGVDGRVEITVQLVRDGFEAGSANVRITAEVDPPQEAIVNVSFNDDQTRTPRAIQNIEVAAFEVGPSGELVERVSSFIAKRADNFVYTLDKLSAGDYAVIAVADDNQDGVYDVQRESSGAFGGRVSDPEPITLGKDQRVQDVDIPIRPAFVTDIVGGVGSECQEDGDCTWDEQGQCITSFLGGYCSRDCAQDGYCGDNASCEILDCGGTPCSVCLLQCVSDSQCRPEDAQFCDAYGTCSPFVD